MALPAGARLGPYEVIAPLGAGGMGEVYKARDTRLDRTVAVKVLPTHTIASEDGRHRFVREARAISQLQHPNICTLFDVGREGDTDFLVMELVDGESLQARLARGPLPLPDVLRHGAEIASALDRAHKNGIAHRDLKPGNVMLTKSGIKLIDFGLARSIAPTIPASGSEAATATAHAALTGEGAVVGTPQYMAPEQLEGKPADARTDVFALGGVLHEMVAGKPAFSGVSAATLASEILRTEAAPLTTLRAECPPALERVVRACLVKDPDERLQSAHDVKLLLEGLTDVPRASVQPRADARHATWRPWAVAAFATSLAVAALLRKTPAPAAATGSVRFQVPPPAGGIFTGWSEATTFSFSPDGRTLAFSAVEGGITRLYLRPLASLEAKPVPGSEGGRSAFWSPDGKALAFFANSQLKRLELSSGAPVTVCNVRPGAGITGTWGADGQILFASIEGEGIFGVKSEGGEPRKLLDPAPGTLRVSWPSFLPDGRRFLYLQRSSERDYQIMLGEAGREPRSVRTTESLAQYLAPGYLVFARDGTLLAQRFDADNARVSGDPIAIAEPVAEFATPGWASFAVSATGAIAYQSPGGRARLAWFDREGRRQPLESLASALWVRVSPDGSRALFNRADPRTGNLDIWALDIARGGESRITSDPDTETFGLLVPDGSLVYSEGSGRSPRLKRRDLATGETRSLLPEGAFQIARDYTPDGTTLVYGERDQGSWDLFTVPAGGGQGQPLLRTPFDEFDLRLSPDGRYAAFVSNETGRPEVYVAPFPRLAERVRATQEGARAPHWSHDGRELTFITADLRLVSLPVRTTPSLELGAERALFALEGRFGWAAYDVARDGRFLAIVTEALSGEVPITVVLDPFAAPHDAARP
jgi:eukaryotic-like serine/threonine-protein kinase